jgi:hypothetical protein
MHIATRALLAACGLFVFSVSLAAQWPDRKAVRAPRLPDGSVDLNAPAPRTPDGKPDLSGVFRVAGRPPGAPREALSLDEKPVASFRDIGEGFKDGLPLRPWAKELLQKRMADNSKDNPDAHCLPMGFLQFHLHPQPRKIVQTPGVTLIVYEANYGLRQIFTDGRSLPNEDANPTWEGYSIGKWEGDTLVVQSSGFRDGGWLDVNGSPFTDKLKLTERFTRLNYGTLRIDITVDDPKAYTKPWTVRITQRLTPEDEMIEFVCNENEQSSRHYQN